MKTRYFIVFWYDKNVGFEGWIGLRDKNCYPNHKETKEQVTETYPEVKCNAIRNIIELSEQDYKDWVG